MARPPSPDDRAALLRNAARYATVGYEFVGTMAISAVAGVLLDRRCESTPVGTLIGGMIGIAAAFALLIRRLRKDLLPRDKSR